MTIKTMSNMMSISSQAFFESLLINLKILRDCEIGTLYVKIMSSEQREAFPVLLTVWISLNPFTLLSI